MAVSAETVFDYVQELDKRVAALEKERGALETYEYHYERSLRGPSDESAVEWFNKLGAEGWELMAGRPQPGGLFVFKRAVRSGSVSPEGPPATETNLTRSDLITALQFALDHVRLLLSTSASFYRTNAHRKNSVLWEANVRWLEEIERLKALLKEEDLRRS